YIVESGIAAGAFPGAQVLVAKDGKVVYHETFGFHTYDSLAPVRRDDLYDFASVTKITSALPAIIKWTGEDKFDIDAPLKAYFPAFSRSNKASLSYRSMLAHNARLRPWIPYWRSTLKGCANYPWKRGWDNDNYNNWKFKRKTFSRDSSEKFNVFVTEDLWLHKDYKEKRIYKAIKKSPLNEKQEYKYSGLLFYLLPEIVANHSGMDYETYLKQTFYQPLGAYTLTFNPERFFPRSRIIPTERDTFFRKTQLHGTVHDEGAAMMGGFSANAGLFGSAGDLAKLMQMYMNYGTYGGERYITESAMKEFTKCQYCDQGNRRGLGFDKPLIEYSPESSSVAEDASPASFGHSGYTGTFTWADPESGLLFIFFSNRVYPTRFNGKIYEMGIRPRIHQVLYDAMKM
ncbi:MAG: class A beta-lactamase-related serine hydrolase, partial [Bacteroidetes bacterium]